MNNNKSIEINGWCYYRCKGAVDLIKARVKTFGLNKLLPEQLCSYTPNDIIKEIHSLNE